MMRFKLDIFNDGRVRWHGVETGVTTVMANNPISNLIALKIAGYTTRSGSGPLYDPAHYAIYAYETIATYADGICIEVDELFGELHWKVRSQKPKPKRCDDSWHTSAWDSRLIVCPTCGGKLKYC